MTCCDPMTNRHGVKHCTDKKQHVQGILC